MDFSSIIAFARQLVSFILTLLKAVGAIDEEEFTDVSGKANEVIDEASGLFGAASAAEPIVEEAE